MKQLSSAVGQVMSNIRLFSTNWSQIAQQAQSKLNLLTSMPIKFDMVNPLRKTFLVNADSTVRSGCS